MIPPLVYIAGYGRSGSTLLEQMLARALGALALGEASRYFRVARDPEARCSCGETLSACPVWRSVSLALGPDGTAVGAAELDALERLRRSVEASRLRGGAAARDVTGPAERRYAHVMRTVFSTAAAAAATPGGAPFRFLVDSSKTAFGTVRRPQALAGPAGLDVRVLHLVRDSRGVVASMRRGLNRRMERGLPATTHLPALRAAAGWVAANRAAERCGKELEPDRYRRIRYEDLVEAPDAVLEGLGDFLGAPATTAGAQGAVHQVAGNRARLGDFRRVEPDLAWHDDMAAWEKSLLDRVLGRWMRRYGY